MERLLPIRRTYFICLTTLAMVLSTSCDRRETKSSPAVKQVTFKLLKTVIPSSDWQTFRVTALKDAPRVIPAESKLRLALKSMNRANVRERKAQNQPQSQAAFAALRVKAWQYTQRMTADHYLRLGRTIAVRLVDEMIAFAQRCAQRGLDFELCLDQTKKADQMYLDVGGTMVLIAAQSNLLGNGGVANAKSPLIAGLFMNHWSRLIEDRTTISSRLHANERRWYLRWLVEYAESSPLRVRLDAARELQSVSAYPAAHNAAVLLARNGQHQAAIEMASLSTHPQTALFIQTLSQHAEGDRP